MKTKISHLGRSTVSVILAVMMLLSTMLIGTVSTVNAVGANNYKVAAGETLYLDLSANSTNCANFLGGSYIKGSDWFDSLPDNKIISVQLTKEIDFSSYEGRLYNINSNGWHDVYNDISKLPSNGQNMVVVNADNSYYWSTYSGGSTTEKNYYVAGQNGLINGTQEWGSTDLAANKMEYNTDGYYSITYTDRASGTYQFKITDDSNAWYGYDAFTVVNGNGCTVNISDEKYKNISVTLPQKSNVTIKFNIDSENNKHLYVIAESALPKVADSVTLTASSATVTSGGSTTLTATLTGKKSNTVIFTLVDGNGTTVETKSVTADSATFTVTPSAETTYKVVASAEGCNSVESAAVTVHIVGSKTFYLWRSSVSDIGNKSYWDSPVQMQMNDDGKYVCDVDVKSGNNFVTITEDTVNPYNSLTAWNSENDVNVNVTETSSIISNIYVQPFNVHDKKYYFPLFTSTKEGRITFAFDGAKALVASDAGSTPVGNVTIKVPTVDNAIVTAKSGTVTADEGGSLTVAKGSTFEVTVTPDDGYEIAGITYNGNTQTTSPATFTAAVSGDITVTVNKPTEATLFKVAYGSNRTLMEMVATRNKGIYISTATVDSSTESDPSDTPTAQFTIYDVENSKYAVFNDNDKKYIWLTESNRSKKADDWIKSYTHGMGNGLLNNGYGKKMYVIYNANTQTVTLTDSFDTGDKATLYVKRGTSGAGATGEYASNSEAPKLSATSSGTTYKKYSVEYDTNVNIQTTMSDKYLKARYYVAGYSVNGRSYPASAVDASKGIYQTNITITEDIAENGVVEVTPIYYNRTIEDDDNYITFYVDAERLVGDWGSTVAIYAYAYEGGTANKGGDGKPTNNVNLLGAYPGQPMVKDGQYYVAKIPRCNYVISSDDGSLKIDKTSPVAGITLNNYYNETVHNSLVPIKRNMQTYDFSDFVVLAKKKDVKTIMFQSKFYNATGDAKENRHLIYGDSGEIKNPTTAKKHIDNIESANVNPYEDFTDYYGRATDLIGNILDETQKADKNNLYVISTGSYDSSESTSGYSTKGEWVTIWNVYDHNGNLITYGTPANFLDETTEQYKKIAENYSGKPVKISYEKGLVYGQNKDTSRTDGRWYYSALGQEFTSDVAIEYKDKDDTYKLDTNTNTANTGFIGETSGATATINDVTTASFSSVTDTAHLNIKVANGWRFDGWFIKQGDKYTEVSDNYTDISTDVLMSNSYHIVARVSQIPSGTLELNHTAYTGTDPTAHEGTGFYYISAVVKRADNSQIKFGETQGKISIDKFTATDSLEITLKAKCHGDNTVFALYKGEAGGYTKIGPKDEDLSGKSEFTYTFTVPADSLFENGKLAVNALNYYTDIVKIGGTCEITYMYKDRFGVEGEGKMVSYVVRNVELSTEEIRDNNYIPFDSTITKYAPRIDTMYLETKWILDGVGKVEKGKSQATVIATQTKKMCKVYYPTLEGGYYTDIANSTPYEVDYNTLLMDENGNFILSAPETDESGKQFSYWDVYKADKNGGNTGELVTKCYERNFGLRIMADYYIEPVYGVGAPTLTANINAPVLNREIYGDSANPKDKLYVDLLTAFTSSDIPTFKENTTPLKVECGVFVVRNNTSTLSVDHRNTLVQEALDKNKVDTTSEILKSYKRAADTEELVVNKLKALAVDSNVKDKSNTFDTFDNEQYRITKFIFDNDTLTNKNRIDEVLKYTNNTANQNYIFSAYAFVVIKYSDGRVKEKKISAPQYFNLCYVGNKAL